VWAVNAIGDDHIGEWKQANLEPTQIAENESHRKLSESSMNVVIPHEEKENLKDCSNMEETDGGCHHNHDDEDHDHDHGDCDHHDHNHDHNHGDCDHHDHDDHDHDHGDCGCSHNCGYSQNPGTQSSTSVRDDLIIAGIILFLSTGVAALPLLYIKYFKRESSKVMFVNVFASGTILGLCFVHILPEAVEKVISVCGSKLSKLITVFSFCWVLWRFIEDTAYSMGYRRHQYPPTSGRSVDMEDGTHVKSHKNHDHDGHGCDHHDQSHNHHDSITSSCAVMPDHHSSIGDKTEETEKTRTGKTLYLSILATSVHCFVEGALVVVSSQKWISMVAILLHKLIVAFSFGYKVAMIEKPEGGICLTGLVTLAIFLLSTPASIVIVTLTKAQTENNSGMAVMDWLAAGFILTLSTPSLYDTRVKAECLPRICLHYGLIALGLGIISAVVLCFPHDHGHGHSH